MKNNGVIHTKKKKDAVDEGSIYEMYYDYEERIKYIKPHRILAINRAENEKVVTLAATICKGEKHPYRKA